MKIIDTKEWQERVDFEGSVGITGSHDWHAEEMVPVISDHQLYAKRAPLTFWRSDRATAERFQRLAAQWRAETSFVSNPEIIHMNFAYQQIIGLGPAAVRHILEDLATRGGHWFWALEAIVGENKAEGASSIRAAREAWLAWGREAGFIR